MALTKETVVDQITVTENGIVLVREVTKIIEDGVEISKQYHRSSFAPDSDVSKQPQNVKDICALTWTPEVIAAYEAQQKAQEEAMKLGGNDA
jgi:hypothetical protein